MALIDIECVNEHKHEVYRPIADWPSTPPCPTCGAMTTQILIPTPTRYLIDPVIVFRAPDGSYRFPGDAQGAVAGRYRAQGFQQIELRSAAEVRKFESHMSKREYSRATRRVEAMQANREARESATRSELRRLMGSMTEFGRQVARTAMARNDAKPRERAKDPGCHFQAFSYDRSNREESRDEKGRRRRD